jgi:hypothetical protein
MTRRITKPAKPGRRPEVVPSWLRPGKLAIKFNELPGAIFHGEVLIADIDEAIELQAVRHDFETTDCIATLWENLSRLGFGHDEIERAILNPATITSCGYGGLPDGPTATLVASLN